MNALLQQYKLNDKPHWYIAWLTNKVILGIWDNGKDGAEFDFKLVLQLRIFNEAEELFIWKKGSDYVGRLVASLWDKEYVFKQQLYMWGTKIIANKLREPQRGLEIELGAGFPETKNLPLRYQVENLFAYDTENGNLVFTDARLTHIRDSQGNPITLEEKNATLYV